MSFIVDAVDDAVVAPPIGQEFEGLFEPFKILDAQDSGRCSAAVMAMSMAILAKVRLRYSGLNRSSASTNVPV